MLVSHKQDFPVCPSTHLEAGGGYLAFATTCASLALSASCSRGCGGPSLSKPREGPGLEPRGARGRGFAGVIGTRALMLRLLGKAPLAAEWGDQALCSVPQFPVL